MKNKKQKILILGVGNAQVDAIRYCKDNGYEVFTLGHIAKGPGITLADHFQQINIINKELVTEYCIKNGIDCIYSVGSDIAMPVIGYVAEKLKLPFLVCESIAELLKNKAALRKHLNRHKISEIKFVEAGSFEELDNWNLFPAILKPVDSQGQRGVKKINSKEVIEISFKEAIKHSFCKKVIIEEYIPGDEISVNSFVYNNKVIYNFISDRIVVDNFPGGIVKGHNLPTKMPADFQRIAIDIVERSIQSMKISNGPVYFQLKYSGSNVKIIEMTARLDGCHIWRLIKMNYGIDLLDLTFKTLLNLPVTFKEPKKGGKLRIEFPLEKPGCRFKSEKYLSLAERAFFYEFYYNDDEIVRSINGHLEKTGVFIT